MENNGGCEHTCSHTIDGSECSCMEGYSLNSNGYTCDGMLTLSVLSNQIIYCACLPMTAFYRY